MPSQGYALTITAVDRVTGVLDRINGKIAASQAAATRQVRTAYAPWQRLGQSIHQTSKLLGVDKIAGGIARVATGFRHLAGSSLEAFRNVARIVEPLGLITGAASIAGVYALVTAFGQFGSQLGFAAQRIDVGASQLQSLQGAAELAGSSAGSLTTGLQSLGQTLYDAAGGRNTEAVALFQQLGITWRDSVGHAKGVMDVLPQLADKIASLRDPYAQAQVAAIAFGGAADDLLPFLRLGSKGIAEYNAAAARYGVLTQKQVQAANALRISQVKVDLAVHGFVNTVAAALSPALTPLLTQMADWIAANKDWLAQDITHAVTRVVAAIKGVDWHAVGQDIKEVWSNVSGVVAGLGGWGGAAKDVLIVMGVSWGASIIAPLAVVAAAIARVTASFVRMGVAAARSGAAARGALSGGGGRGLGGFLAGGALGFGLDVLMNGLPDGADTPDLHSQFPGLSGGGNATAPDRGPGFWQQDFFTTTKNAALRAEGRPQVLYPDIEAEVRKDAIAAGIDPNRAVAQFRVEGGGYSNVSPAGAFGPAQLMPGTAKDLGVATSVNDPNYDWHANVKAGIAYQKQMQQRYFGNQSAAEVAYNWGPGNVDKWSGDPNALPAETRKYVTTINSLADGKEHPLDPTVKIPPPAPDVTLPSSVTDALSSLRQHQAAGTVDINVKVQGDGSLKTTTNAKGSGVGKTRVTTPMQAHAA